MWLEAGFDMAIQPFAFVAGTRNTEFTLIKWNGYSLVQKSSLVSRAKFSSRASWGLFLWNISKKKVKLHIVLGCIHYLKWKACLHM